MTKRLKWMGVAVFSAANPLIAGTIFSNLTPNLPGIESVPGANVFQFFSLSQAESFTPGFNATMTDVQVSVAPGSPGGSDTFFDLSLFSDNAGMPGSSLMTVGTRLATGSIPGIETVTGLSIPLTAGIQYWLVMTPFDANSYVFWNTGGSSGGPSFSSQSSNGSPPWSSNGSGPSNTTQFEIDGTPAAAVPEPGTFAVTQTMLGLVGWRLTQRGHC